MSAVVKLFVCTVILVAIAAVVIYFYNSSTPKTTATPSPTPPAPEIPEGTYDVFDKNGTTRDNYTMTFASDKTVKATFPSGSKAVFPVTNMTYTNTSIDGKYTDNATNQSVPMKLPILYNVLSKQIAIFAPNTTSPAINILKPTVPKTPAPTYQPVDLKLLEDAKFEVFSGDGSVDQKYTFTFKKDKTIVTDSTFPLTDITYTESNLSGTDPSSGKVITAPLYLKNANPTTIVLCDTASKPLFLLKPFSSPTTTIPSASTTPSSTPTVTTRAPQPTDRPSTVKGRYIQIISNSQCMSFTNIKVYGTPYGSNLMALPNVTVNTSSNQPDTIEDINKTLQSIINTGLSNLFKPSSPVPTTTVKTDAVNRIKSLIDDTSPQNHFMTSCYNLLDKKTNAYHDNGDSEYLILSNDVNPWITIDFGEEIPIYKIILNSRLFPYMAIGAIVSILNKDKQIIYTGAPLADMNGSSKKDMDTLKKSITLYNKDSTQNIQNIQNKYYGSFTFYPSLSTKSIGAVIPNYMVGLWVSSDTTNQSTLTISANNKIQMNIINGPVKSDTYTLITPVTAQTKLGATPAPSSNPKPSSSVAPTNAAPTNANIFILDNSTVLVFNNVTYYKNILPYYKWTSYDSLLTFDNNMGCTLTSTGTDNKPASGKYTITQNHSDGNNIYKMTLNGTEISFSIVQYSTEKVVLILNDGKKFYPINIVTGTFMSLDQNAPPITATFSDNMKCVIGTTSYRYTNLNVDTKMVSPVEYEYNIIQTDSDTVVYIARCNRGILTLYNTNAPQMLEFIKNPFVGTWTGQVIYSGKTVTWVIDTYTVYEKQASNKLLTIGDYVIHGPNTAEKNSDDSISAIGLSATLASTYVLTHDNINNIVQVFSYADKSLIANLSKA